MSESGTNLWESLYEAMGFHRDEDGSVGVDLPAHINRCANPSLEVDTSGYATSPSFWINEGAVLTRDTSLPAVVGEAMGKVIFSGAATFEGVKRSLTLTEDEPTTVSVSVRGAVGGEVVKLSVGDSINGNTKSADVILTTAPQRISVTLVPTASGASGWALVGPNSKVTQTIYFDAIQVESAPEASDYIDGDQPGCEWLGVPGASTSTFLAVDTTYPLRKICEALCSPLQPVYDLVRERDGQKGWAVLLDPDECPVEFLPYLAQWTGVRPQPGWTEEHLRNEIKQPTSWKRGQPEAIRLTAQRTLTGSKLVIMRERTPEAGCLYIRTLLAETPNPAQVLSDLRENTPAWILLDYEAVDGVTVLDVASSAKWETVADLAAAWSDVKDLAEILPSEL
jgi:Phage tail protein (Tail_P2_I)